jgi:hypothetical protein
VGGKRGYLGGDGACALATAAAHALKRYLQAQRYMAQLQEVPLHLARLEKGHLRLNTSHLWRPRAPRPENPTVEIPGN